MGLYETARTRLANPRRCVRAEPAVGGDERVEIKEILKMMVSGTTKSAPPPHQKKGGGNGDDPERIFWKCVKIICSGTEIQG